MIDERVMGLGDWDLRFDPDTPRGVFDRVLPYSEIVVMPGRVDAVDMDSTLLDEALFRGPVFRVPTVRRLTMGGHSQAAFLGTGERYFSTTTSDLPYLNYIGSPSGSTLAVLTAYCVPSGILTVGTVTDPSGGLQTSVQNTQWISHREYIDSICKVFDVEWRINNDATLDIGPHTTLYPSPSAVLTPNAGSRETGGYVGFQALAGVEQDWWDFASQLYVQGRNQLGHAGGASSLYVGNGSAVWVTAVVDGSDIGFNDPDFAASRYLTKFGNTEFRSSMRVTTDMVDVDGVLAAGARVYVYDPDSDLQISGYATQVEWRGETIFPLSARVLAKRWPVTDDMGVLLRSCTGPATVEWFDLTDYIIPETGATEVELGYDVNLNWWH